MTGSAPVQKMMVVVVVVEIFLTLTLACQDVESQEGIENCEYEKTA